MSMSYSITNYPDAADVTRQLKSLVTQPLLSIPEDQMNDVSEYFEKKCMKSKTMIELAKQKIPGGVQHNLAFNYPFPLVIEKAEGAYLWDIDGNKYIDFLQAGGPTVLGSNPPEVREKVIKLLNETGPCTGLFHEYEYKLADKITQLLPSVDFFRMLGSGTESCMAAIRVARLATKKKNIVKMGGAYHGWSDQLAFGIRLPGTMHLEANGVPRQMFKYTQEFYPNDTKSLEKVLKRNQLRGGTAAVLIEPVGPESGTRPLDKDFNKEVRRLCDKYGALLIFDEVVTAFRIGLAGAQGYFDVSPDLTVFGKVVAGGYPSAGGLGGQKKYMKYLSAGIESGMKVKKALIGGTMAANPLSSAAGYFTLCEMEKQDACAKAGRAGDRLTNGLKAIISKYNLPYVAFNQGAICHLETGGAMLLDINLKKFWTIKETIRQAHLRKEAMEFFGAAYTAEGVITLAGSRLYTSAADTDEIVDDAIAAFDRVFSRIRI
ncbi:MAG: aminotransferase class III-fold pyridoxal phosphate-dependent enzyme [Spirochaetales bacterium]|nr:aminotransferase class III-fold pyridoxal phosphate-dependent enzyme [Spirochaetales bacterium]